MAEEVRYERVGAAAVLTIDRPGARNAVDFATAAALRRGFDEFEADDGARVLVLTGAGAVFGCFERRWGVPLVDGGTQRLPRLLGLGRALDLILSGRPVDAEEALRIGLASEVVAAGAALERALELAERLAAFPQETMLADRRAAIEGLGMPLADGLGLERRLGRATLVQAMEGAARFAAGEGRHGEGV